MSVEGVTDAMSRFIRDAAIRTVQMARTDRPPLDMINVTTEWQCVLDEDVAYCNE